MPDKLVAILFYCAKDPYGGKKGFILESLKKLRNC